VKQPKSRFAAVCFDFDSTLSRLEGIDELAARRGVEGEIAPLTVAAMEGTIPLESVYGRRLEIIRPTRSDVDWLAKRYIEEMVPGVAETFSALRSAGSEIFIVSGGIRAAILPFAAQLELPPEHVFAVSITLDAEGLYRDFDCASPLTKADGKAVVCKTIAARHVPLAMVGDGATDMAARDAGAYAIGFGGVTTREAVRKKADVFIEGPSLAATLDCLLLTDE
jgi:phosphoserine phosphatase